MSDLHPYPYEEFKQETVNKIIENLWPKNQEDLLESLYGDDGNLRPLKKIVADFEKDPQMPSWVVCQIYIVADTVEMCWADVADTVEMCWADTEDLDRAWERFNGDMRALARNLLDLTDG